MGRLPIFIVLVAGSAIIIGCRSADPNADENYVPPFASHGRNGQPADFMFGTGDYWHGEQMDFRDKK